jgi:hypothetical protein
MMSYLPFCNEDFTTALFKKGKNIDRYLLLGGM